MLPQEVTGPLKAIGKKNPVLALLLTLLIIVVVVLYLSNNKGKAADDKRCSECENALAVMRHEKDSTLIAENKLLREIAKKNEERKGSQDTAIKAFNKITR